MQAAVPRSTALEGVGEVGIAGGAPLGQVLYPVDPEDADVCSERSLVAADADAGTSDGTHCVNGVGEVGAAGAACLGR